MNDTTIQTEPGNVSAKDGTVSQQGPDAVDVKLTPEAAEETSNRLLEAAMTARGQKLLKRNPHRPR